MPRQLNFPLQLGSENIVNHSHDLNEVLNYTKQVFFICLSFHWIVLDWNLALGSTAHRWRPCFPFCYYFAVIPAERILMVNQKDRLVSSIFTVLRTQLCFSWRASRALRGSTHTALQHYENTTCYVRGKGEQLSLKPPEIPTTVCFCMPKTSIAEYFFFCSPLFSVLPLIFQCWWFPRMLWI